MPRRLLGELLSTLKVVIASTRPGRVGLPVGQWVTDAAHRHGGFDEVEVLDLAQVDLPLLDEPHHPRLGRYENKHTQAWAKSVAAADAFVFVSPEYNWSVNAALKNALDYLSAEWAYKPVGLVTYGGIVGGARAIEALRPVLASLRMMLVRDAVMLPMVFGQVTDNGFAPTEGNEATAVAMFSELAKLVSVLSPLRQESAA